MLVLLRIPAIQTYAVKQSIGFLEQQLGSKVELAEVNMSLPIQAQFIDLKIYDKQHVLLLETESLELSLLSFSLWDYVLKPDESHILSISSVELDNPGFYLYKQQRDSVLNLQRLLDQFVKEDSSNTQGSLLELDFPSIELSNGHFAYLDSTAKDLDSLITGKFNPYQIHLEDITGHLSLFIIPGKEMDIGVHELDIVERHSAMQARDLSLNLHTSLLGDETEQDSAFLSLEDINLIIGQTKLYADIQFPERELTQVFDFEDKVDFLVSLKERSQIDFSTIEHFSQTPLPIKGVVRAEGNISGNWQELSSERLILDYGDSTHMASSFRIRNYMQPEQTYLNLQLTQSQVSFIELQELLPEIGFPQFLTRLDLLDIRGTFDGKYDDFHLATVLHSEHGGLEADLNLQLPPNAADTLTYTGSFSTDQLNVDALRFTENQFSNNLTSSGTMTGKGASLEELDVKMDVSVDQSTLFGKYVQNLHADFTASEKKVDGTLTGSDREGSANLGLTIDLSTSPALYQAKGSVTDINLARYAEFPEEIWASSEIDMNMNGDSLDLLNGELKLKNFLMRRKDEQDRFEIPELWFQAVSSPDQTKYYNLKSSLVHLDLTGQFRLLETLNLTEQLVQENLMYFQNQDSLMEAYYQSKDSAVIQSNYQIAISTQDSLNDVFSFFNLPLHISEGSMLIGGFLFGESEQANLTFSSDSTRYDELAFRGSSGDLFLAKNAFEEYPFLAGGVQVSQMKAGPRLVMDQLALDLQGADNIFVTDLRANQVKSQTEIKLKLRTLFASNGSIRSSIDPEVSMFSIQGDTLTFNVNDSLIWDNQELSIYNLVLQNDNQYFHLRGTVSDKKNSELNFSVSQLSLGILSELYPLSFDVAGKFNAEVRGFNLLKKPRFEFRSRIDDFALNEYAYGQISINSQWQDQQDQVDLDAILQKDQDTTLILSGYYSLVDTVSPIFMSLETEGGFPLNYVDPFVEGQLYNVGGNVSLEEFVVKGPPDDLTITGVGHFEKASFGISYFQTEYSFNGKIVFDNTFIQFPRLRLYDQRQKSADLHGLIRHKGLREFEFNLQLDSMNNFLVMDTRKQDNETFYGKLFLKDGIANITGNLDRISVQAIASTGNNSSLKIPVTDYEDFGKPDYIYFVNKDDSKNEDRPVNTDLQGFELDLTILATKDAEVELIFDERIGDVIRAKGAGSINMYINESGDFTMNGEYEIIEGSYLFTSQNVINKKFTVKEGGKIKWSGDPFDAELDLRAAYPVRADLKYLFQSSSSIRTNVNVLMHMEGLLSKPEIGLSIELPSIRGADAENAISYLQNIHFDEQELNKQVFSLMVFNRFAPIGGDLGDNLAGIGVTTSISELLSNQLNLLLSQVTGDNVDVNVNTSDFQDLNLLVSARLFDDRVTIERDGTLVQSSSNESSRFSIGNIRIILKLLPSPNSSISSASSSSEMVMEVFTRDNFNANAQGSSFTQNQTGLGIFYKKDFDRLSDLLKKKK